MCIPPVPLPRRDRAGAGGALRLRCAPPHRYPAAAAVGRRPAPRTTDRRDLRSGGRDAVLAGPEGALAGPVPSEADIPGHESNGFGHARLPGITGDQVAVRLVAQPDAAGHGTHRAAADTHE
ncbi:hypothetical protein [Streptomyces sp. bgisy022]|uniref:hypothetical protein n=1 Tax=Streptomyces sp. bgisy022 TaxID=3413769 RepID=UPI003D737DFF